MNIEEFREGLVWYRTFKRWSELGYQVKRGEKSCARFYGKPVFSASQVKRPSWYDSRGSIYISPRGEQARHLHGDTMGVDMEDDAELAFAYGISPWGD